MTSPAPCSWVATAGDRSARGRVRGLVHPAAPVQRSRERDGVRAGGHGHRARLPLDAGHQLRGRQHRLPRGRPLRAPRRAVQHAVLAGRRHRRGGRDPLRGGRSS